MRMLTGCLMVTGLLLYGAGSAFAVIYQWEDNQGVVNFTDNPDQIPAKYRKKARVLEMAPDASQSSSGKNMGRGAGQVAAPNNDSQREAYWRNQFGLLRREKKDLEDGLERKRDQLVELHRKRAIFQRVSDRLAVNQKEEEIRRDENRIKEIEKQLADLDIQAAQEAVPLEWRK